jgi:hypothetical protein
VGGRGAIMKARTKEEWIEIYNKKTGKKYVPIKHEMVAFHPEHGILSFIDQAYTEPGVFEVYVMAGDGPYWMRLIKEVMTKTGATKIRYVTRRNPKTWTRKYGAHICAYVMEADIDEIKVKEIRDKTEATEEFADV